MDFGYQLCLLISFFIIIFFLFLFLFTTTGETELRRGTHRGICLEAFRVEATLSHALMRGAFCSTVLLLLPFLHSLALAGAGTHRGAWGGPAVDSHPPVSVAAKYLQVQLPPWSPCGGL